MNVQFNLAAEQSSSRARKVGMGIAAMAAASFLLAAGSSSAASLAATGSATASGPISHLTVLDEGGSCPANRCAL
jgi:hypothetical protein